MVRLHTKLNRITLQKRGSIFLPADPLLPLPDPGGGVKMSKLTFSKHGHVAYQLKWNHKCSHMVANISPTDPPQGPGGQKVKIKLFQNIVMLHIKGNRECSNMVANADRGTKNKKHIQPDF